MNFSREYFRPEIRDGFYVDGSMKRAWASSLQVTVDVFAKVCEKYNIRWYADGGTLLGAVRHKGFIPWDDDIDVAMFRNDYEKFKSIMYQEFPESYRINTYDSKKFSNWDTLTRVTNRQGICLNPEFLHDNCECPYPMGLDVFPFDFIPDDDEEAEEFRNLCYMLDIALNMKEHLNDPDDEMAAKIKQGIEDNTGYHYNDRESIELQTFRLSEAVYSMYNEDECSRVVMMWDWCRGNYHPISKEMFRNPIQVSFEGVRLLAASDTDAYLRMEYGDDYMKPDRNFDSHAYPFYCRMDEELAEALGYDPIHYHIDGAGMNELIRQEDHIGDGPTSKILFIIPKASDWKYMQFYYDRRKGEGAEISVLPIPFSDCDFVREPLDEVYEYDQFPEGLPLVDYRDTVIEAGKYDEIVFSFPYDRYNATECIDMKYFSSELRKKTGHLTYISPFETDDMQAQSQRDQKAMMYYVSVPGLVYADTVYVQSEAMKRGYMRRVMDSYDEEKCRNHVLTCKLSKREFRKIFWKKIRISG